MIGSMLANQASICCYVILLDCVSHFNLVDLTWVTFSLFSFPLFHLSASCFPSLLLLPVKVLPLLFGVT